MEVQKEVRVRVWVRIQDRVDVEVKFTVGVRIPGPGERGRDKG